METTITLFKQHGPIAGMLTLAVFFLLSSMDGRFQSMDGRLQGMDDEIQELRIEMAEEFKAVRVDMAADHQAIRTEMAEEFKAVRSDVSNLVERVARVETRLDSIHD